MTHEKAQSYDRMNKLKCCVIVPTYNNYKTLKRVLDGILLQTSNVIIVNDGSTDTTKNILAAYQDLAQIHLEKNKGKGNALRQGFKKAKELGYNFAITIDSDGQHFPEDIPVFLNYLEQEEQPVLLIGSRNMAQQGVPKRAVLGTSFQISGFGLKQETSFRIRNQVIVCILWTEFRRIFIRINLNLKSK